MRARKMTILKMALPKGHLWENVNTLLNQAGYGLKIKSERSYIVFSNDPEIEMKIYRAQNIPPLVEEGRYDLGITGKDWIIEHEVDVEELLDLKFGKVNVVVAIPKKYGIKLRNNTKEAEEEALKEFKKMMEKENKKVIAASEYENITKKFIEKKIVSNGLAYRFIRSYGATEAFIGDVDLIVECTETGETLEKNDWEIIYTLFPSTARLIANKKSLKDPLKMEKIYGLITLLKGSMNAERLKLLKMNVPEYALNEVIKTLPAMKSPTISSLHGGNGKWYAVETVVPENDIVRLIPLLKKKGATDIIELDLKKAIE
jgi:ATP phosphoribosyltransferase